MTHVFDILGVPVLIENVFYDEISYSYIIGEDIKNVPKNFISFQVNERNEWRSNQNTLLNNNRESS